MSSQSETVLSTQKEIKPSSLLKHNGSQIEINPSSPIVDGHRQSTIAFKVQRTNKVDIKPSVTTDNENIAPVSVIYKHFT